MGSCLRGSALLWEHYPSAFGSRTFNCLFMKVRTSISVLSEVAATFFATILIAWMIGTSVQKYRVVHFQHHQEIGGIHDSEMTYFFPLNLFFVIRSLLGIRVLEVLASRKTVQDKKEAVHNHKGKYVGLLGLLAQVAILCATCVFWPLWLTLAWIVGLGAIFPFFGALRQLLEHRDENANSSTNYFETNHGAYTRMFDPGAHSPRFLEERASIDTYFTIGSQA